MVDYRFEDRVVIISGAAGGLGKAYAELLASLGARLVLVDMNAGVNDVAAKLGGIAVVGDVADPSTGERAAAVAMAQYGRIDALINNAGIGFKAMFAETELDDYRRLMDIHYFGTVNLTRAVWPHMVAAGYGRIVNTISGTLFGLPSWLAYSAAKGAIFAFSRSLAVEGEPRGILLNMIMPSAYTGMMAHETDPAIRELFAKNTPEMVAPTAAYLAHEACSFAGRTIASEGGLVSEVQIGQTEGLRIEGASIARIAAAIEGNKLGRFVPVAKVHFDPDGL